MAQYEEGAKATLEQLQELENSVSSDAVKQALEAANAVGLYGSDTAGEAADVSGSHSDQAAAVSNAKLNDARFEQAELLIVSRSTGHLTATNDNGVTAELNDTYNLHATFGNGDDNLTFGGTSGSNDVSVETGDGNDKMHIMDYFTGKIESGTGDLELTLDTKAQENAEISVDAGDGFDLMIMRGQMPHSYEASNENKFVMHSANIEMKGINVVATDVDSNGVIELGKDHITVLAATEEDSLIAKLYKVALGREAIDDADGWGQSTLGGFNWWTNEYEKTNDISDHEQLVRAFLNCDEFHNKYDSMNDTEYVNALFSNLGVSDVEAAQSYINQLANGSIDRETVAWQIATSETAVKVLGNDGEQYVIDGDFSA